MGSIVEMFSFMFDVIVCFKGIFDWYGMWFCIFEFVGCLFECVLVEFGVICFKVIDVVVCYCDDLLVMMEMLFKDVVFVNMVW